MRPLVIVALEVAVEHDLHLLDGVELGVAALDPEVLVEQRAAQPLDDAVRLGPLDPGDAVLDLLELQELIVGVAIRPAIKLLAVVGENGLDAGAGRLESRQHVIVHLLDRGGRQLRSVDPGPGVAAVAVDRSLQVDPANAVQHAHEERVDRDQGAGVRRLNVALQELRREALQQPDLLVAERGLLLRRRLLQAQQALVLGQQPVAVPDPAHSARRDL